MLCIVYSSDAQESYGCKLGVKNEILFERIHLISKVEVCVHDNARKMVCRCDLCPEWNDLSCFGHTLQICLMPALETQTLFTLLAKCRK